jgi:phage-related protein
MADDYSISAKITADSSGYEEGVKKAIKAGKSLSTTLATVGLALNGITAIFNTVGKAIGVVTKTASQCTEAFKVQLNAEKTLDMAVRNSPLLNGESSKNLKQFASSMQAVTNYGDEQLLPLISQLTTSGRTEAETMKIIKVATNMASTGMVSLETAVNQLNMTMNGSIGRLGVQNKELKNLTKEELENGKAVDILAQKYKGMAQAVADPTIQLKNLVGDLKESVGSKLMPTVQMFASEAIKSVQKLISLVESLNFNKVTAFFKVIADETKAMATSGAEKLMGLFSNMKDVFSSLAESDGFKKAVKIVNTIIDAYAFLYSQIATVFVELGNRVKDFAENVWEIIKRLFESSGEALDDSTDALSSWGNAFYNIFNNMFKQAQDVIYSITALIRGDWSLAWEYMKLACARVADSILDILSNIVNAFPKMIENIVNFLNDLIEKANQVRKWFGGDGQWDIIQAPKKADFSKSSGLEKYITDTEKKISELTGKSADKNIKDIDKFTAKAGEKLKKFSASFSAKVKKAEGEIAGMGKHFVEAVSTTTDGGAGGEKSIGEMFDELIAKLKNLPSAIKAINLKELITRDFENIKNGVVNFIPNMKKQFKKGLDNIRKLTVTEIKEAFKKGFENAKKIIVAFMPYLKRTATVIVSVFQGLEKTLGNILNSIKGLLTKAFELNLDDSIEQLLKYEDKILTFFVETVPKLPSFVASAIQSISTMFKTLNANVDKGTIATVISEMITNLANELPSLISNLWSLISKVANGIVEGLNAGIPAIKEFGKTLPETIKEIITDVSSNFGNFEELLNGITDIFETFVTSLAENDIFADLGELFSKILTTVINSIDKLLPSIEKALDEIIPALGKFLTDSIPSIVNLLIDVAILIVKEIPKIVLELVKAIPVIVNSLLEALPKFFDEGLPELISGFIKIIPDIIKAGIDITIEIIKHLPEIIGSFIEGLILGFAQVNWWDVIVSIFKAFIDGFKKLFGIHSPSTFFQEMGGYMVDGLLLGLQNVGKFMLDIFTKALEDIKKAFEAIGDWFKDLWKSIRNGFDNVFSGIKDTAQKIGGKVGDFFGDVWDGVTDVAEKVGDGVKWVGGKIAEGAKTVWNGVSNAAETVGEKVGGFFKKLKFWASGTNNAPAGLAVVGEAGPELVRFRGGEQVLNAKNTQKVLSGAGTSNNFTVNFNNTIDTTAFTLMQQLKQYNRQMAINGII